MIKPPTLAMIGGLLVLAAPATAFDPENGKKLYEKHCAGCHGESGKPFAPDTPDLSQGEGLNKSDFEIAEILKSGSKTMPAYAAILTDDELLDVVIHVRSLPF